MVSCHSRRLRQLSVTLRKCSGSKSLPSSGSSSPVACRLELRCLASSKRKGHDGFFTNHRPASRHAWGSTPPRPQRCIPSRTMLASLPSRHSLADFAGIFVRSVGHRFVSLAPQCCAFFAASMRIALGPSNGRSRTECGCYLAKQPGKLIADGLDAVEHLVWGPRSGFECLRTA